MKVSNCVRAPGIEYLAQHLVEPGSLAKLHTEGGNLATSNGRIITVVGGVPVFSALHPSPQWRNELKQTADFADTYLAHQENCDDAPLMWCEPWLNDKLLCSKSRTVCLGGSFADDVPHISQGHKFNVDLWAHEYTKLASRLMSKQDTLFVAAKAEALPFLSGSVDYIYTRNAIDHFDNPIQTVKEIHRVLKDNCRFILAVYYDSSWFDAHETKVVDKQFLEQVITPLFDQEHLSFNEAEPTGPVLEGAATRFMFYVGTKRAHATLPIDAEAIERYELIGTSFQKALYEREEHQGDKAREHYLQVLRTPPVCDTDPCRQLHACLDLLAMTDKDALLAAAAQLHAAGIAKEWAPIADLTLGRYGLTLREIPAAQRLHGSIASSSTPFKDWKWLVTLASCAELLERFEAAKSLRELAVQRSPQRTREWLAAPALPKSKGDSFAHGV